MRIFYFNNKARDIEIKCVFLFFAILFNCFFGSSLEAKASEKIYVKRMGVPIGIKRGEEYPFEVQYAGLGSKTVYIDLSKVHRKTVSKDGIKKVSFLLTYRDYNNLLREQADQIAQADYYKKYKDVGIDWFYTMIDGKTGKCVLTDKNSEVTMEVNDSKGGGFGFSMKLGYNGEKIWRDTSWYHWIDIEYPENMKNIYLGIGGSNVLKENESKADKLFFEGKVPYRKTTFYKKGKNNSRWVLLDKL